jgi:hypothetical protein
MFEICRTSFSYVCGVTGNDGHGSVLSRIKWQIWRKKSFIKA